MIVIMRDAIMPDCCNTCVCSEGYGCGITGTIMATKEMESRPDWCPLEEVEPCEDAVSRKAVRHALCKAVHKDEDIPCENQTASCLWSKTRVCDYVREIDALPSITPKAEQRWIPVTEMLPFAEYGEGDRVYCYCHDEKLGGKWAEMLYFNGGVWCKPTGETFDYKVLAWYPLPTKPYRAERRENENR